MLDNRHGQAAIEYLMNYAWALALIIVVGAAIFSLGLTDVGITLSGSGSALSEQFEQVAVIGHQWQVTPSDAVDDTFRLTVQNNAPNQITVDFINITEIDGSAVSSILINQSDATLFPGETAIRSVSIDTSSLGVTRDVGDKYTVMLDINYTDTDTDEVYGPSRLLRGTTERS